METTVAADAWLLVLPEEEARLRALLLSYMEQERMTVGQLEQGLIAWAVGGSHEVKRKELAEFLSGHGRPGADLLAVCATFTEAVGMVDELAVFGDGYAAFGQAMDDADALAEIEGRYDAAAYVEVAGDGDGQALEYGGFIFERAGEKPFLKVLQWEPASDSGGRGLKEGIAVAQAHGASVILRDVLTRLPAFLMLAIDRQGGKHRMSGVAMMPGFDGRTGRGGVAVDIELTRTTGGS